MAVKEEAKTEVIKPGFNEQGERVVVTLANLKEQHGPKAGEAKYREVRDLLSGNTAPRIEDSLEAYAPDLSLVGIKSETRVAIEKALKA